MESIVIFEDDVVFPEGFNARLFPIPGDLKKVERGLFCFFHPVKRAYALM